MSSNVQTPPPRSPFRTIANGRAAAQEAPHKSPLTALPVKQRLPASEKLAAKRTSIGATASKPVSTSRLSTSSTSSSQLASTASCASAPSSNGILNRRPALSRRLSSATAEGSPSPPTIQTPRSPAKATSLTRTGSGDSSECTSDRSKRRPGSSRSTVSTLNAIESSPSDVGTVEDDTDATSDVEGSRSSRISPKSEQSPRGMPLGSTSIVQQCSDLPSALESGDTPKRSPRSTHQAHSMLPPSTGTGLGIFNLASSTDGGGADNAVDADDSFASVKGLMADLGDTIGTSAHTSPDLDTSDFECGEDALEIEIKGGRDAQYKGAASFVNDDGDDDEREEGRPAWKMAPSNSIVSIVASEADSETLDRGEQRSKTPSSAPYCDTDQALPQAPPPRSASLADMQDKATPVERPSPDASPASSVVPTPDRVKRGVWGFLRSSQGDHSDAATAANTSIEERDEATPVVAQNGNHAAIAMKRPPTFAKFSQQLSGLASNFKTQHAKQNQAEADKDDELRVRLPRRAIDEDKLAELIIKCAEAKHVLRTDSSVAKLREVGLKLEEGWREQLVEAQALRSRLDVTQDTVEDLEDENKQLRCQLGTLSEQIVLREEDLTLLQQASVSQLARERALWEEEAKQTQAEDHFQLARVRRLLSEERSLSAHLELMLASAVSSEGAAAAPPMGDVSLSGDDPVDAPMAASDSQSSLGAFGGTSHASIPSFEIHDADNAESATAAADPPLEHMTRRISMRNTKEGSTEFEVLFHVPPSPGSSRVSTDLFSEPPAFGHFAKLARLSPLLSPSSRRTKEAAAASPETDHGAQGFSSCSGHRVRITPVGIEGVPDSVSRLPLLEHKVLMVFGSDPAYLSRVVQGAVQRGAAAIAVACPSQGSAEAVLEGLAARDGQVKTLAVEADFRSTESIAGTLTACTAAFDGLDCIINAYRPDAALDDAGLDTCRVQEVLVHLPALLRAQVAWLRHLSRRRVDELDALDADDTRGSGASGLSRTSVLNVVFEPRASPRMSSSSSDDVPLFGEMYKQAVFGLTKDLAVHNEGTEVRINAIVAGEAAASGQIQAQTEAEDGTISYLLSDLSEFVTGAIWTPLLAGVPSYTCAGPPLCAIESLSDPSTNAESRAARIRARLEGAKAVSDEEVLKATRDENALLQQRTRKQEERIQALEMELDEVRERLRKTEEAVSGLF